MTIVLRSLQTAVPETVLAQSAVRDLFAGQPGLDRLARRLIATAFDGSGIETRRTVIGELAWAAGADSGDGGVAGSGSGSGSVGGEAPRFFDAASGAVLHPGTKTRNERYAAEAAPLFTEAARRALDGAAGIGPADVTHLITVSCTGFFAPGPDFVVARALGLPAGVQRYHLGFMGCYAALPALRAAAQFCAADPQAVVLVVCAELCTLHLRSSADPDAIVACSLFADGAAAGIVSARPLGAEERGLALDAFGAAVTPTGERDMAWTIGDHGFEMVLSAYVPAIIDEHVTGALEPLLAADDRLAAALAADAIARAVPHWAIHPGGRAILDRVQARLGLDAEQLAPARGVLREYGNMSSATVLFVLQRILGAPAAQAGDRVAAMAFGPGLTVESALLTVAVGGRRAGEPS